MSIITMSKSIIDSIFGMRPRTYEAPTGISGIVGTISSFMKWVAIASIASSFIFGFYFRATFKWFGFLMRSAALVKEKGLKSLKYSDYPALSYDSRPDSPSRGSQSSPANGERRRSVYQDSVAIPSRRMSLQMKNELRGKLSRLSEADEEPDSALYEETEEAESTTSTVNDTSKTVTRRRSSVRLVRRSSATEISKCKLDLCVQSGTWRSFGKPEDETETQSTTLNEDCLQFAAPTVLPNI